MNNPEKAERIYPIWAKLGEESNMSLRNSISQVIAGMNFKPKSEPKIPLLVIAAKHDRLAHYSCSEAIVNHASKATKVKFVLNEDPKVGHGFQVDDPLFIVNQVKDWIQTS